MVEEEKKKYTAPDIARADHVRRFQNMSGESLKRMLHEVNNKVNQKFNVNREYIKMAKDIYGPSVPHL